MKQKPLIFQILLILFLIEPLVKIIYFKNLTNFELGLILNNLLSRNNIKDIFDFWLVFPIAGLALIRLRKWSYFVFLSMMGYSILGLVTYEQYTWPYNSPTPFSYNYFIVAIALISLIIFLFPQIREPFFNKSIRWWETKKRYRTTLPCKVITHKGSFDSKILNLSQTGVFLKDAYNFRSGEEVYLEFYFKGQKHLMPAKIMTKHPYDNHIGWGAQFNKESFFQKIEILKILSGIKSELRTR